MHPYKENPLNIVNHINKLGVHTLIVDRPILSIYLKLRALITRTQGRAPLRFQRVSRSASRRPFTGTAGHRGPRPRLLLGSSLESYGSLSRPLCMLHLASPPGRQVTVRREFITTSQITNDRITGKQGTLKYKLGTSICNKMSHITPDGLNLHGCPHVSAHTIFHRGLHHKISDYGLGIPTHFTRFNVLPFKPSIADVNRISNPKIIKKQRLSPRQISDPTIRKSAEARSAVWPELRQMSPSTHRQTSDRPQ